MGDPTTLSPGSRLRAGRGRIADVTARVAGIGADPEDGEDLRQKKALLVLVALLVLPVSVVWGTLYLAFGSLVGIVPFVYFAVSIGSLVVFARTRNFRLLLVTQLLDIMLTTTIGQMLIGGFLPARGVGLGGGPPPPSPPLFLHVP